MKVVDEMRNEDKQCAPSEFQLKLSGLPYHSITVKVSLIVRVVAEGNKEMTIRKLRCFSINITTATLTLIGIHKSMKCIQNVRIKQLLK